MADDVTDLDPLDFDDEDFDDNEDEQLPPAAEVAETSEPANADVTERPQAPSKFEELQRAAVRIRAGNIERENELAQLEARLAEEEVAQ